MQTESPQSSVTPAVAEPWTNRRILLLLALGTLIVSALWRLPEEAAYVGERAGEVFVTLVLAMSFTYLLRPVVDLLHRTPAFGAGSRTDRAWATIVVFVACVLILVVFTLIALKPITDNVRAVWNNWFVAYTDSQRHEIILRWQAQLQRFLAPIQNFLPVNSTGDIDIPDFVGKFKGYAGTSAGRWFSHLGFIVELLLVPVLVFYFLTDGPAIRAEASLLLPLKWRPAADRMCDHFDRVFEGYIRGQVFMCLIAWVLVTAGLLVLQIKYAFTLGLMAGLARGVPVIGPLIGAIPIVLVCLLTTGSLSTTIIIIIGFTVMHLLESKVLLPKIVGHEVDLHPVTVIVALLLGMEFFGFLGIFLAVPIAALVKIVLAERHEQALLYAASPVLATAPAIVPDVTEPDLPHERDLPLKMEAPDVPSRPASGRTAITSAISNAVD